MLAKQVSWLLNELLRWFKSGSVCLKWSNIYLASPITKFPLTCLDALVVCQISHLFNCFHSYAATQLHKRINKFSLPILCHDCGKIKCSSVSTIIETGRVVRWSLWEYLPVICNTQVQKSSLFFISFGGLEREISFAEAPVWRMAFLSYGCYSCKDPVEKN